MCVRDAYWELLRWPTGSAEWSRFIEYPHQDDLLPLARHLGVSAYDVGIARHWNELIGKLGHPGIAMFDIPAPRPTCARPPRPPKAPSGA